jgi:hypothetical protein
VDIIRIDGKVVMNTILLKLDVMFTQEQIISDLKQTGRVSRSTTEMEPEGKLNAVIQNVGYLYCAPHQDTLNAMLACL